MEKDDFLDLPIEVVDSKVRLVSKPDHIRIYGITMGRKREGFWKRVCNAFARFFKVDDD